RPVDVLPMRKATMTGQPILGAELEIAHPSGQSRHIFGNAVPLRDEHGAVRGCLGTFIDITERKQTEQRLAFEHDVTHILTEVETLHDAAPRILQAVCRCNDAQIAMLWRPNHAGDLLRCEAAWIEP